MKLTGFILTILALTSCSLTPTYVRRLGDMAEIAFSGQEVKIAVIDSGIDLSDESVLPYLVANGDSFLGLDLTKDAQFLQDFIGHGALVNKIVAEQLRRFPQAKVKILPIKAGNVLAPKTKEATQLFVDAVEWAIAQKADVLNLSLISPNYNPAEYKVLKKAQDAGMLIVAAAGNDNQKVDDVFPCNYNLENILCIGSGDNGFKSKFSNFGQGVDLYIDGEQFYSAYTDHMMFGTSFSAPQISAALALAKARDPKLSAQEIKQKILWSTDQYADFLFFKWDKLF